MYPTNFFFNNFLYFFTLPFGHLIVIFELTFFKAPALTLVIFLLLIIMLFNFLHPLKLFFPIVLTFFPITTLFNFLLFFKAFAAIDVTLYVTFPYLTVDGTDNFVAFLLLYPTKAIVGTFAVAPDVTLYVFLLTVNFVTLLFVLPDVGFLVTVALPFDLQLIQVALQTRLLHLHIHL